MLECRFNKTTHHTSSSFPPTARRKLRADNDDDDVVRCFIKATLKHSKAPGAVRASKKRYPFLRPVISRGCQG